MAGVKTTGSALLCSSTTRVPPSFTATACATSSSASVMFGCRHWTANCSALSVESSSSRRTNLPGISSPSFAVTSDAKGRPHFESRSLSSVATCLTEGRGLFGPRTPLLDRNCDVRQRRRSRPLQPSAVVKEEQPPEQASVQAPPSTTTLKEFLEGLKAVGRVRLIVNTGVAVLESVTNLEKLFYRATPKGEYANVMSREENVDFHLLVEKVTSARLVKGKSMKGDIPTYMVRFYVGEEGSDTVAVSVLVMWKLGTDGDYDPGQVEAFQALLDKYGEEVKFQVL